MIDRIVSWSIEVSEQFMERFGLVSIMTPAEFFSRLAHVIESPRANLTETLILLTIVLLVLISIIIFAVLLVIQTQSSRKYRLSGKGTKTREVERPRGAEELQELLHAEGVTKDEMSQGVILKRRFVVYRIAGAMLFVALAWIVFGAGTAVDSMCLSCHDQISEHITSLKATDHGEVKCVSCHETGGSISAVTTNVLPRTLHIGAGFFGEQRISLMSVSTQSCMGCHESDVSYISRKGNLRISHKEPIEAGMACVRCHYFATSREHNFADAGMSVCIQCHSGERASSQCKTCHASTPSNATTRGPSQQNARALLTDNPQNSCYGCHDPGPCDQCHGIRVPHTDEFMMRDSTTYSPKPHIDETHRMGVEGCTRCHHEKSPTGIGPCTDCHAI